MIGGWHSGAPRVALVHYWLVSMRGGERVLERLLDLFPGADVFTHVYDPDRVSDKIRAAHVRETFIGRLPGARRHYQKYLPLMPMALEELDLRGYDLVISSESGPAKGIITRPDALHVCYCHSPMRYLWDHYPDYKAAAGGLSRMMMPAMFHRLRQWDVSSASRVDGIVANSSFVARRIRKVWGRQARVVHPPVAVGAFKPSRQISDRYLWVSQMTPYKRADVALEAFNRLGVPALMVGDGEMFKSISARAGPNVEVRRRLSFEELQHAYATCKALVFTPEEDFGIVPVEANASGRPVIAYGHGGVTDSIVEGRTGLFFREQTARALCGALQRFETWQPQFRSEDAIANAARFSPEAFATGFLDALDHYRLGSRQVA
ncbi:glycosyltransferase [Novosphingobium mangrovi (ex Huang et al. 2023)]|uniref:Glycosyltransferase n=1 Tax=Novosphingobium mangrovi (ex Huang et al. 2023) TaxID=2976432 RepID=A0ABT2I1P0_9SPHN|nr:glycosyltransferase [Novosphingobium mangrovi (ex Huang et al. 2023)]MCT2398716.1 glycosyltransferase [Novosphingobium mangrovi (ex Huang et al. 2023)]